jgi:cytochrome c oxidase assembly factor CtaG
LKIGSGPYAVGLEPLFLVLCALAAVAYWRAGRHGPVEGRRAWLFAIGVGLVAGALNSPLETLAKDYLLLIHLLQNVMLADWAPPLLILGLTPVMRTALARLGGGGRALAFVARPKVALPLWLAVWYAVHLAAFYDFALRNEWALNVEHALLLAAGLVFWWPVLAREQGLLSTPASIAYLGIAFVTSVFLGLALMFSTTAFYDYYEAVPRLWGLSAVRDQNLGGLLMNVEQTLVFLAAIAYFLLRLLGEEEEAQRAAEAKGRDAAR